MIKDCIELFSAAFCCREKMEIDVTPDCDVYEAAQFISLLSGRCEISESKGKALLKPLKKFPTTACAITVARAEKELFFLIAGIAVQLGIVVKIDSVSEAVSDEELLHLRYVTQNTLAFSRQGETFYFSSMLMDENPLFAQCEIPAFSAGLCLGSVLARNSTLVEFRKDESDELIKYVLSSLENRGALIYPDMSTGNPIIKSMKKYRFGKKTVSRASENCE